MARIVKGATNWEPQAWVGPAPSDGRVRASALCMLRSQY
jgi:hypothetical protein